MGRAAEQRDDGAGGLMERFLAQQDWAGAFREALPGDFSARRYVRLSRPEGAPARALLMLMPGAGSLTPFLVMQRLLAESGVRVPTLYAADEAAGLALIEDLGPTDMLTAMAEGMDEAAAYEKAASILARLHAARRQPDATALGVPLFNAERFLQQLGLFPDDYLALTTGHAPGPAARREFDAIWQPLLERACAVPQSLMLRDYHASNIMLAPDGYAVIDFQDGGVGPVSYDLVSLLEDTRRDVSEQVRAALMAGYMRMGTPGPAETFSLSCHVLAVQRHLRVLAILARKWTQGEAAMETYFARTWRMLLAHQGEASLAPVFGWLAAHVPEPARQSWRPLA